MREGEAASWGRYPRYPQRWQPMHSVADVRETLARLRASGATALPWGAGRSYGDVCQAASGQLLAMRGMDRFLGADWTTGVLEAEAGVTLHDILQLVVPRGWFLPVTPGTRWVTLGGAIANDVHGKNHHRVGTFGRHVHSLRLMRSDRGLLDCSRTQEPELFAATVGGLGLSGVILSARLQLVRVASSDVEVLVQRFGNLDEFFALSDELDPLHEFSVSWVDCLSKGQRLGRGVYSAGNFAADGALVVGNNSSLSVPFTPPLSLVQPWSLRAFNALYWRKAPKNRHLQRMHYQPFFYPLDGIGRWNRLYGPRGFQQYQAVLPEASARDGIAAMLRAISEAGRGSFLAVLKRCGNLPSPGLLSFPMAGTSLALDFSQADAKLPGLLVTLDAIVRNAGGRVYLAKDARMSRVDFQRAYPCWEELAKLKDAAVASALWMRVSGASFSTLK